MHNPSPPSQLTRLEDANLLSESIRALVYGAQLAIGEATPTGAMSMGLQAIDSLLDLIEHQRARLSALLHDMAAEEIRAA